MAPAAGGKSVKVPNFTEEATLPVELVGGFIQPTIKEFAANFKFSSFSNFEKDFIAGLKKLPMGHEGGK